MKKKTVIVVALVLVVVLLVCSGLFLWLNKPANYKQVDVKGYTISVPEKWDIKTEDNELLFTEEEEEKGRFVLMYQDCELKDIPAHFGYTPENLVISESDEYAAKVYAFSFTSENKPITQYVFNDLPTAPPYKAVLTLHDVSEKTALAMLSGVKLPDLGKNPPAKPVSVPEDEALADTVYTVRNEYGYFSYNLTRLEQWIKPDAKPEAEQGLSILAFDGNDDGRTLKTWYHIVFDGSKHKLFTYYQVEDGQYIYDNNPRIVTEFKKEFSEEEDYSRYMADDIVLLEGPYNKYSENKDALLQYKGTKAADSNSVEALVMASLPAGIVLEKVEVQSQNEPKELVLKYTATDADQYVTNGKLNEAPFYQNSLVLFSLVEDVDRVTIEIATGGKNHTLTYNRKKAEEQFENKDIREFAESDAGFAEFTEEVPNVEPPTNTGSGNKNEGTRVLKTATVVMKSGSTVKHPNYDEYVSVEQYAKRFGVAQYLDKPITITLNERVKNGKTTMWAAASCNGKHIGTYPIKTLDEFDALIAIGQ